MDHDLLARFRGRPIYKKLNALVDWLNAHHLPPRLILSVAAGIATGMALSMLTHIILHWCGLFPPLHKPMRDKELVLIALCYHSFYAIVAAYLTAYLARDRARKAAFFLGSKEAIMWILGMLLLWNHTPPWYNLAKAVLGIPLALTGGWLYERHYRKKTGKSQQGWEF